MEHNLISVLIVDDEKIVREGLKLFIDWTELGFCICGEASDGEDALKKMMAYQPGLVLLDIRMPKMLGTELIQEARKQGFAGEFIFLSSHSDFKYAQTALQFGAAFYLTKPLDEKELTDAVLSVKEKIIEKETRNLSLNQYISNAKNTILTDLLLGKEVNNSINYMEMGLSFPIYQVVIYENYLPFNNIYNFADLLKVTNHGNDSFEHILLNQHHVIVLKGNFALNRFQELLKHYEKGMEKGSPLDSIFIVYGPTVSNLSAVYTSYEICVRLMERRFFCQPNQHVLSFHDLPDSKHPAFQLLPEDATFYSNQITDYIKTGNKRMITETLTELNEKLYACEKDTLSIKHFLADIFLEVKHCILYTYPHVEIPFTYNAAIIELIEKKFYLYEIMQYFLEQFEMIIRAIGSTSSESVMSDILFYIKHNFSQPLKLENIAPLFGYNSAYLGKIFTQKMGMNFNAYLDQVRIEEACRLLLAGDLKVYEISSRIGFKSVDYFQIKFKRIMGESPSEYKKKHKA